MGSKTGALLQMLENKSEINICIYIDDGLEVNDRPLSKVTCRVRDDLLILNKMIPIPVNDHYIASLEDDKAEIIFLDPDHQVVHVKIVI
jgi:hypothetical protein